MPSRISGLEGMIGPSGKRSMLHLMAAGSHLDKEYERRPPDEMGMYRSWFNHFFSATAGVPTDLRLPDLATEKLADDWESLLATVVERTKENVVQKLQLAAIETQVRELRTEVEQLKRMMTRKPVQASINNFDPEPFELKKPIAVVLENIEDEVIATFFDANVSASGETDVIAFNNLKEMILLTFESLADMKDEDLGPGPLLQKRVLCTTIRRR